MVVVGCMVGWVVVVAGGVLVSTGFLNSGLTLASFRAGMGSFAVGKGINHSSSSSSSSRSP